MLKSLCLLSALLLSSPQTPHKVYVIGATAAVITMNSFGTQSTGMASAVDYTVASRGQLAKHCGPLLAFTERRDAAEYTITFRERGTTVSNATGDIVYTSPARYIKNAAKDVCRYFESAK